MALAEYLASEQAREDVGRLLAATYPRNIHAIVGDIVERLAAALGVSPAWLAGWEERP